MAPSGGDMRADPHNPSFLSSQWTRVASGMGFTSAPTASPSRRLSPPRTLAPRNPGGDPKSQCSRTWRQNTNSVIHRGGSQPMGGCLLALYPVPGPSGTGGRERPGSSKGRRF